MPHELYLLQKRTWIVCQNVTFHIVSISTEPETRHNEVQRHGSSDGTHDHSVDALRCGINKLVLHSKNILQFQQNNIIPSGYNKMM